MNTPSIKNKLATWPDELKQHAKYTIQKIAYLNGLTVACAYCADEDDFLGLHVVLPRAIDIVTVIKTVTIDMAGFYEIYKSHMVGRAPKWVDVINEVTAMSGDILTQLLPLQEEKIMKTILYELKQILKQVDKMEDVMDDIPFVHYDDWTKQDAWLDDQASAREKIEAVSKPILLHRKV